MAAPETDRISIDDSEFVAVIDTNVLLDLLSCHDAVKAIEGGDVACAYRSIVDARIGRLWTPGSGDYGHADRLIVDSEIGVVDAEIGIVDSEIGIVDAEVGP